MHITLPLLPGEGLFAAALALPGCRHRRVSGGSGSGREMLGPVYTGNLNRLR